MNALAVVNSCVLGLILFILHDLRNRVMRIEDLHLHGNCKKGETS